MTILDLAAPCPACGEKWSPVLSWFGPGMQVKMVDMSHCSCHLTVASTHARSGVLLMRHVQEGHPDPAELGWTQTWAGWTDEV